MHAHTCVPCVNEVPKRARRHRLPWRWSYRLLISHPICMMGPALGFFGTAAGALNHLSHPSTLLFETGALTEASQQTLVSSCLHLPNVGITGKCYHSHLSPSPRAQTQNLTHSGQTLTTEPTRQLTVSKQWSKKTDFHRANLSTMVIWRHDPCAV